MKTELIDREMAKKAVKNIPWCDFLSVRRCLDELPAIDPESVRPKGEWEEVTIGRWIYAHCPYCNTTHDAKSNFCPNCGRDMRGTNK